jgi:hypothetical protein
MERVRPISPHLQLDTRTMRGRVDRRTWNLPDDLSEDEWIEAEIVLAKIGAGMMWWVGDYWIYGDKKYGGRKAIVDDPNWQGPSFQTCASAASVCRAFEPSRRREVLSFGHHAEVAALEVKEADRLLDWAEATIATTGKPRSSKNLRREVRQLRARLQVASSSPALQAENLSPKKGKQPPSRDQKPSAQPSAAPGIRIATLEQLIDALVIRATGKPDSEIAQIAYEITERLNELKTKGGKSDDARTKSASARQKATPRARPTRPCTSTSSR